MKWQEEEKVSEWGGETADFSADSFLFLSGFVETSSSSLFLIFADSNLKD